MRRSTRSSSVCWVLPRDCHSPAPAGAVSNYLSVEWLPGEGQRHLPLSMEWSLHLHGSGVALAAARVLPGVVRHSLALVSAAGGFACGGARPERPTAHAISQTGSSVSSMLGRSRNGVILVVAPGCALGGATIRVLRALDSLPGVEVRVTSTTPASTVLRAELEASGVDLPWSEHRYFAAWFDRLGMTTPALVVIRHGGIAGIIGAASVREPEAQLGAMFGVELP